MPVRWKAFADSGRDQVIAYAQGWTLASGALGRLGEEANLRGAVHSLPSGKRAANEQRRLGAKDDLACCQATIVKSGDDMFSSKVGYHQKYRQRRLRPRGSEPGGDQALREYRSPTLCELAGGDFQVKEARKGSRWRSRMLRGGRGSSLLEEIADDEGGRKVVVWVEEGELRGLGICRGGKGGGVWV